jgi:hypothetical protein
MTANFFKKVDSFQSSLINKKLLDKTSTLPYLSIDTVSTYSASSSKICLRSIILFVFDILRANSIKSYSTTIKKGSISFSKRFWNNRPVSPE